ncbi:MAG TPA: hypothetical protein VGS58_14180 [Candidatus Sulfopaludibacter sp.]|nr:hypothetical protein [Candidatus Sulfopaludibacter sp.]
MTLAGPRGAESGTITVAAWGADHCKVTITLGPEVLRRQYTAVVNGQQASITAPADLLALVALPLGPRLGCALLPQGLAYGKLAAGGLTADPATARPVSLAWIWRGRPAALSYGDYQAAGYAATVTASVGGTERLQIHFDALEPASLAESDFALPPPPADFPKRSIGGGQ